jgi:hypothetical protein
MHMAGKLAFIHRQLWERDRTYRISLLIGPAVLAGVALGGLAWWCVAGAGTVGEQRSAAGWARPPNPLNWAGDSGAPLRVAPSAALPPAEGATELYGYRNGWTLSLNEIHIQPGMSVDVGTTTLGASYRDGADIDMTDIMAGHPAAPPFVAVLRGELAVRAGGTYALSIRLDRPAAATANCIVRLALGQHRIVSSVQLGLSDDFSKVYGAGRFDLSPGLYPVGWVFGCWRGGAVTAPGRAAILVQHPGETRLSPAAANDFVVADHATDAPAAR